MISQNQHLNNPPMFVGIPYDLLVWYDPTGQGQHLLRSQPQWATRAAVTIEGWDVLATDIDPDVGDAYRRQYYRGEITLSEIVDQLAFEADCQAYLDEVS